MTDNAFGVHAPGAGPLHDAARDQHPPTHKAGAVILKWLQDKIIALFGLLCLGPAMLLLAAIIRLDSPGPILFRQRRFGMNGTEIEVLKFRTIYAHLGDASGAYQATLHDPRVTRVGRWLRRTSLDELPQLFNVLRGDMSIVGPRPHPVKMMVGGMYYHHAFPTYHARHRVKPGITGLAQVSGCRGPVLTLGSATARLSLDLAYIERWSPALDMKVIWLTIPLMIREIKGQAPADPLSFRSADAAEAWTAHENSVRPPCPAPRRT